jgi:hypothetical protein
VARQRHSSLKLSRWASTLQNLPRNAAVQALTSTSANKHNIELSMALLGSCWTQTGAAQQLQPGAIMFCLATSACCRCRGTLKTRASDLQL